MISLLSATLSKCIMYKETERSNFVIQYIDFGTGRAIKFAGRAGNLGPVSVLPLLNTFFTKYLILNTFFEQKYSY